VILPEPRPDMRNFAPYRTQQMKADVRLQANEWADPNPAARYITQAELERILLNRYPRPTVDPAEILAEQYGVGPDQIIVANGSNEVLLYSFLLFGGHGRSTLLFQPTYSMHARLAQTAGSRVIDEVIGLPYDITTERVLAAIERHQPEIVCLTSPNNPTGTLIAEDTILAAARAVPRSLLLVDEAYADFAGFTVIPRIAEHPNIVVVRTFSKVRAAAGLRFGMVIAHPQVAAMYRGVHLPYDVNSITMTIAARIAKDTASIAERVERNRVEREKVYEALRRVDVIEVFPSETNFILFRLRGGTTDQVHALFLEQSVLVRDISMWPGCASCLRVSIGTPEENDRFIAALPSVFGAAVAA
jgi:histidinol-phosphate aminotransferase